MLATNQAKRTACCKQSKRRNGHLDPDPEETILRAFAYDTPRAQLVADLKLHLHRLHTCVSCP